MLALGAYHGMRVPTTYPGEYETETNYLMWNDIENCVSFCFSL